jgi:hypothetical protein
MKWLSFLQMLAPALALIPGFGPIIPFIVAGAMDAEALHGSNPTNDPAIDAAKHDHVVALVTDAASALNATGKITLPPALVSSVTTSVFKTIDDVQQVFLANHPSTVAVP